MAFQRALTLNINVNSGQAVSAINALQQALGLQTQQTNQSSQATAQNTQVTNQNTQAVKDWQQSIDRARRNAYSMTIAGYQLAAAGRAMVGAFKEAVNVTGEVDYAIRRAATTLGIMDDSTEMFKGLGNAVSNLAIQTKLFDPETVARGFYYWGSTVGETVDSLEDLTRVQGDLLPIMQVAAITETNYETAIKGVVGALQQFQKPMSDATELTEQMFYITQKTANEFPDLIEALKMVGPVAYNSGESLDTMLVVLGKLGDAGIRGTTAGRSLRQMLRQLSRETPRATKALDAAFLGTESLGKSFKDIVFPNGKFAGLRVFIDALAKSTMEMNEEQKGYLFNSIATAAELPSLITMVDQQTQYYKKNAKAIEEGAMALSYLDDTNDKIDFGEAHKTFAESWQLIQDSIKGIVGELQNKMKPIVLDVGRAFVEVFKPVAKGLGDAAMALHGFAEANPDLFKAVVGIAAVGSAVVGVSGMVLLLAGAIRLMTGAILPQLVMSMASAAIKTQIFGATNVATAASVNTLRDSMLALHLAQMSASASFGRYIQRIVAGQRVMRWMNVGVLPQQTNLFSLLGTRIRTAGGAAGMARAPFSTLGSVFGGMKGGLLSLGGGIRTVISFLGKMTGPLAVIVALATGAVGIFAGLGQAMGGGNDGVAGAGGLLAKVLGVIGTILGGVVAVVGKFGELVFAGGKAIGYLVVQIADWIGQIPGIKQIGEVIGAVAEGLSWFAGEVGKVFGAAGEAIDGLIAKSEAAQKQWDQRNLPESVRNELNRVKTEEEIAADARETAMLGNVQRMWDAASQEAEYGIDGMLSAEMQALMDGIPELTAAIDTSLVNPFNTAFDQLKSDAAAAGQAIPTSLSSALSSTELSDVAKNMIDSALGAFTNPENSEKVRKQARETIVTFADEFYHSGMEGIAPAATGVVEFAMMAMNSKNPELRGVGEGAIAALAAGYADGGESAVGPVTNGILNWMNEMINSDSEVKKALGYKAMAEYATGLANNEPNKAVAAVLRAAVTQLSSADAGVRAAGYNKIAAYANGMVSAMPGIQSILQEMNNAINDALKGGKTPGAMRNVARIRAKYMAMMAVQFNSSTIPKIDYKAPTIKTPTYTGYTGPSGGSSGGGSSGGGSGGSGGSKQTPLEKALEVAQQGRDLYEALRQLDGVNLKALVKRAMGGVADAMALSVKITYKYAKTVSKSVLKKVAEFAEVAGAIAGAINTAVDAFKGLKDYKNVANSTFTAVASDMKQAVSAMYKYGKGYKAKTLVAAKEFAETAGAVAQAMAAAIEVFVVLHKDGYSNVANTTFQAIASDMKQMVAAMVNAGKGFKAANLVIATDFSAAAGTVAEAIGNALGVFKELKTYQRVVPEVMDAIIADIKSAVTRMQDLAKAFNFSPEQLAGLTGFAEMIGSIMGAISSTWDTFNKTIQFVDQFRERPDLSTVFADMKTSIKGFTALAEGMSPDLIAKVGSLAETVQKIAGAIESFFGIGKNVSQDPGTLSAMVAEALAAILIVVDGWVSQMGEKGADFIVAFADGMQSQEAYLAEQMARIRAITGGTLMTGGVVVNTDSPTMTIVHIIKDPDGALRAANSEEVAAILSGNQYLTNLVAATQTQ